MKDKKKSPYSKELIDSQFWLNTPLSEMSDSQWEAICDGCARCCLHKFIEDESIDGDFEPTERLQDGEEILYTNISCYLLNDKNCMCTQYDKRSELVPDCVSLTKDNLKDIFFMPPSCSYRRLQEGKGLANWHPLLNKGKKAQMHQLGISVRNRVISEAQIDLHDFENYIVHWPSQDIEE
ncbi:YcgN family cysteine cluster protein [Glaciecola petra]|uniref:YcgN family cysteine cluster protein n=1 Tax=Glaciecola petra TaxID=3075602 RepID=A0ABU2ZMU1_9ALTE|nr:YcgN family cysteine cluster protein [Aestuariibacter sp. P117]MDT0593941.1 YcgN family cysteine cluster protein [Aestuariibacter sp. P117]